MGRFFQTFVTFSEYMNFRRDPNGVNEFLIQIISMFLAFYLLGLFILLCFAVADSESDDSADDFELVEGIANFSFACFQLLPIN